MAPMNRDPLGLPPLRRERTRASLYVCSSFSIPTEQVAFVAFLASRASRTGAQGVMSSSHGKHHHVFTDSMWMYRNFDVLDVKKLYTRSNQVRVRLFFLPCSRSVPEHFLLFLVLLHS